MSHLSFQLVTTNPPCDPVRRLCLEWAELRLEHKPQNRGGGKNKGRLARRPKYQNLCLSDFSTDGCFAEMLSRKKTVCCMTLLGSGPEMRCM